MGLRFDPMGGGQFKAALKQILEVERLPIKSLEGKKTIEETRLKLFQDFKGKFSSFQKILEEMGSFKKFRELKADLGEAGSLMQVSSINKEIAQPGTYLIEIDQLAQRSSVITNGFRDPKENILGQGYVKVYDAEGDSHEIFIDEDHASLQGVSDLINKSKESVIRATVVKDDSGTDTPWKLILSSKNSGDPHAIDFPDFYFIGGESDLYIEDDHDSQNALIKVDGFEIEKENNQIEDFFPGINVTLRQAKEDYPFLLTITEDYQKISGKVKGLVDSMNTIFEFIYKQNAVDEKTDTKTTFTGDTGLTNIEFRMRNLMHEGFPVWSEDSDEPRVVNLSQLGVEFKKDGMLSFNEQKFQQALEKDFDGVSEVITGDMGFVTQLRDVVSGYTRTGDGLLSTRERLLRNRIKSVDQQITQKETLYDRKQQQLTDKFSRMQSALSAMQRQQAALGAMGGGGGGGGNMVSQLLGG